MISTIFRMTIAMLTALLLGIAGVHGNAVVLQTLFTVLGIVFSISMSLLVSFSISKILNKKLRGSIRIAITNNRNSLLLDFGAATIALVVALVWDEDYLNMRYKWVTLDIMLIALSVIASSLIFEIYNFRKLHKLHTDIEDAIIAEEISKTNRN